VDLLELLKRPEGKTLEFKRDLSSPRGVLKSIVAFANTSGGVILLGVEDGTRNVRGGADDHRRRPALSVTAALSAPTALWVRGSLTESIQRS
jgi:predicted HTH transcriptional regulator